MKKIQHDMTVLRRTNERLLSDQMKLVEALRGNYQGQPSYEQWAQERFEGGIRNTREDYDGEMRRALLRELGEE
jgi:hypothetical protein